MLSDDGGKCTGKSGTLLLVRNGIEERVKNWERRRTGRGEERAGPPRAAKKQNVPFSCSPTSDLYDDSNFDHLFSRQVKVGAGPLGYLFQEYEEAFAPERHARCRRGQGTDSTQEVCGIA